MLTPIALGLTAGAITCLLLAWLGEHWSRTKSENWLSNMSSTEGHAGPVLTGAKIFRDIIQRSRGHKLCGIAFLVLAGLAWIGVVLNLG